MTPTRTFKETATEIARRYGLDDLSRARSYARRFYINSLASKASLAMYDVLPVDDEMDYLLPRYLRQGVLGGYRRHPYLRDIMPSSILPRRNIPSIATRMLYDRRLAESATARREAVKRAEGLLSRYFLDDPLSILDLADEELDPEVEEDDTAEAGVGDKNPTDRSDKEPANAASSSNDRQQHDQLPAFAESRYFRRLRYPRLGAESIYRILEAGI